MAPSSKTDLIRHREKYNVKHFQVSTSDILGITAKKRLKKNFQHPVYPKPSVSGFPILYKLPCTAAKISY